MHEGMLKPIYADMYVTVIFFFFLVLAILNPYSFNISGIFSAHYNFGKASEHKAQSGNVKPNSLAMLLKR